jgi:hypothetical protein
MGLKAGASMVVKRAHTVSKGYMRGWADSRNRIDVVDMQEGRGYPSSIENATVVSYGYEPNIFTHNLERDYERVEGKGTPVLNALRGGSRQITPAARRSLVAFLDMHLDRGRYADQAKISIPAVALMEDGSIRETGLNVGDRVLLSRSRTDLVRLGDLGIEDWPWRVLRVPQPLVTGDGAVLLFAPPGRSQVCTLAFPLSPTHLLVGGQGWEGTISPNMMIQNNTRRWLIGISGSLNLGQAPAFAAERRQAADC